MSPSARLQRRIGGQNRTFEQRRRRRDPACTLAYRLTIAEAGGGRTVTSLAAEVLHLRIGTDPVAAWAGSPPLRRASLTAGMLHAVEDALSETFATASLGNQVVPFPENPEVDNEALGRSFRGRRGRVLLRESVTTTAAGGPTPQTDWKPSDLSPDLSRSMTAKTLAAARHSVAWAYGVLPAMLDAKTTGPVVREGQRHLASWCLQPIAATIANEATAKLGETVSLDTLGAAGGLRCRRTHPRAPCPVSFKAWPWPANPGSATTRLPPL